MFLDEATFGGAGHRSSAPSYISRTLSFGLGAGGARSKVWDGFSRGKSRSISD